MNPWQAIALLKLMTKIRLEAPDLWEQILVFSLRGREKSQAMFKPGEERTSPDSLERTL